MKQARRTYPNQFLDDIQETARFEVSTALTMKNAVFLDTEPNSYITTNTLFLRYSVQLVNAM
jgi:hypothetical protein